MSETKYWHGYIMGLLGFHSPKKILFAVHLKPTSFRTSVDAIPLLKTFVHAVPWYSMLALYVYNKISMVLTGSAQWPMRDIHRYLRKVDWSRHISLKKIHFNKSKPWYFIGHKARQAGQQGRLAGSIDVPTLMANIFAAAKKRTNIHNNTGGTPH
jgi:hypothetical protein